MVILDRFRVGGSKSIFLEIYSIFHFYLRCLGGQSSDEIRFSRTRNQERKEHF